MVHSSSPLPFIAEHSLAVFFLQIAALLAVAVVLGWLARRVGLPPMVGELSSGLVLGPSIFGAVAPDARGWLFPPVAAQQNLLDAVGQVGLVLLVALAAIEMDVRYLRRRAGAITSVGGFGFAVPLSLGIAVGFAAPPILIGHGVDRVVFAVFVGTALAVSAVPVAAKILAEMGLLHRNIGQLILASAVVDDAAGWVLLSITSSVAVASANVGDFWWTVVPTLAAIVLTIALLRPLVSAGLERLESTKHRSSIGVLVALIAFAGAGICQVFGVEAALGAFLAGLVVGGRSPALIEPLRSVTMTVLAPIFLATAGLRVDLSALWRWDMLGVAAIALAVAVVGKFVGAYVGARCVRLGRRDAVVLGAGLNARGAIEIVIAIVGLRIGVLTEAGYTIVVLVAIATSIMAPPLLRATVSRIEPSEEEHLREQRRNAT